jgi:hypothetical protein
VTRNRIAAPVADRRLECEIPLAIALRLEAAINSLRETNTDDFRRGLYGQAKQSSLPT